MKSPPSPPDEAPRLESLRRYELLDTLPEQALDDLTALAAHICEAPISLISLVDEKRQWFKSKIGLAASETPRDVSFCAHALHQVDLFIVPDATTDERFADNPLVTGDPSIRFYAGAPLLTPEGQALGTLCVIDRVPRQLTESQEQALRVLSRQVMAHLELRRQTRKLAARERLLQGIFDSEPECVKLVGPDGSLRMMNRAGLQMIEADSFAEVANHSIYPLVGAEHRAEFQALTERVFRGESGHLEFRIVGLKGTERWLETNATPLRDEDGEVTALLGITRDVTTRRQIEEASRESERRINTMFNASPAAICVSTVDAGRVIDINEQFIQFTGFTREELIGRTVFDLKLWADPEARQPVMSRLKTDGAVREVEAQFRRKNGEVRDVLVSCELVELTGESEPVTISMFLDLTERKRAEAGLAQAEGNRRAVWQSSLDAIITMDESGNITDFNPAAEKTFGYRAADVIGHPLADKIIPPALREGHRRGMAQLLATGQSTIMGRRIELSALRSDGTEFPVELTVVNVAGAERATFLGTVRDITERKRAEEALRASEANMATAQRISHFGSWELNLANRDDASDLPLRWSDEMFRIAGYEPGEVQITRELFYRRVHPEDRETLRQAVAVAIRERAPYALVHRLIQPSGEERLVQQSAQIFFDEKSGQPLKMVGTAHDITEQRKAETERDRLFNLSLDMLCVASFDGMFVQVNPAWTTHLGWTAEELTSRPSLDFVHPEDREATQRTSEQIIQGQPVRSFDNRYRCKDGSWRLLSWNVHPFPESRQVFGVARDITTQRQLADQLEAERARLLAAQRVAKVGSWETDLATMLMIWSDETHRIFETDPRTFCPRQEDFLGLVHAADRAAVDQAFQQSVENWGSSSCEHRLRFPGGRIKFVEERWRVICDVAGKPIRAVGTCQDITERKYGERQLAAFATLGRRLGGATTAAEASRIIVEIADDLFGWDACWLHLYDEARDRFVAVLNLDIVDDHRRDVPPAPEDQPPSPLIRRAIEEGPQMILREHAALGFSELVPFGDTARASASIMIVPVRHGGKVIAVLSIQSYTVNAYRQENLVALEALADQCGGALVQMRAREALRESEERFRQVVESIHEVFWVTDPAKNEVLYLSPAYESIWGRTCASLHASPRAWLEAIHPEDRARIAQAAETKQVRGDYDEIYRILRPDGSVRWIRDRAFPVRNEAGEIHRIVGTAEDITERKNAESLALRSQRLESIGTLAGGVAHDLNNALAPIMMGVELLRMQYPQESPILDMVQSSAKRGADMVRQLLSFAKGAEGERVALQPTRLIRDLEKMMKGSFPKNIQLVVRCDPKLPMILGDATQLDQVLLNLCVNARDAMPHGGTLTLEGLRVEVDAADASAIPEARPGSYVVVRVHDTGTGIPPEIIDRIFDPFFTTKGPDKGTGLGLSTVMGIVKGHGGFLQVSSQPGHGSTFAAYLPAESHEASTEDSATPAQAFRGQGELILLVDDEEAVRETARAVLQRLNFRVVTATDGLNGLMLLAEHRTELRAIITDLHMPHMDGLKFVHALRRVRPDVPILVASGRMDGLMADEFKTLGVTSRLDKPFTEGQLAEALEKLLAPK